jgi:hypothetical protein
MTQNNNGYHRDQFMLMKFSAWKKLCIHITCHALLNQLQYYQNSHGHTLKHAHEFNFLNENSTTKHNSIMFGINHTSCSSCVIINLKTQKIKLQSHTLRTYTTNKEKLEPCSH